MCYLSSSVPQSRGRACWQRRRGPSRMHTPTGHARTPHEVGCFPPGPGGQARPLSPEAFSRRWADSGRWPDAAVSEDIRIELATDKIGI